MLFSIVISVYQRVSSGSHPGSIPGTMVIRNSRPSAKPNHQTQIDSLGSRVCHIYVAKSRYVDMWYVATLSDIMAIPISVKLRMSISKIYIGSMWTHCHSVRVMVGGMGLQEVLFYPL